VLATDGTVTNLIESFLEKVAIDKLAEEEIHAPVPEWSDLPKGTAILRRTVLVRGAESRRIFLHAESLLLLDRLDPELRRELLATAKPIGKLIREQRRESYRELLGIRAEAAAGRAAVLGCRPEDLLVARTYRIHFAGKPAIQITERFLAGDGEEGGEPSARKPASSPTPEAGD
jgi:chorismate-pyruvate lyase